MQMSFLTNEYFYGWIHSICLDINVFMTCILIFHSVKYQSSTCIKDVFFRYLEIISSVMNILTRVKNRKLVGKIGCVNLYLGVKLNYVIHKFSYLALRMGKDLFECCHIDVLITFYNLCLLKHKKIKILI